MAAPTDFQCKTVALPGFHAGSIKALAIWAILFLFFSELAMKEEGKNHSVAYLLRGYRNNNRVKQAGEELVLLEKALKSLNREIPQLSISAHGFGSLPPISFTL